MDETLEIDNIYSLGIGLPWRQLRLGQLTDFSGLIIKKINDQENYIMPQIND